MTGYGTGLCLAVPVDGKNVPSTIFYKDHHTVNEIENMIRNKVLSKNRDQLWAELNHLFARKPMINKKEFRKHIFHMGVELSNEAAAALFRKYDKDKSGQIDAMEYAAALLLDLPEITRKNYDKRQAQMLNERKKEYKVEGPGQMSSWQDSPDVVEKLLREKISTMTTRSSDQIRQAMRMFGGKTSITLDGFKKIVKNLGIEASDKVKAELFRRYDVDGNQDLDLYEFVKGLMPPDLTAETFNVTAEKNRRKFEESFKRTALLPEILPQHLEKWKKGPDELERLLVEKLEQRVSTSAKQLGCRQAFKLFSKDGQTQISRTEFLSALRTLGFILSPDECNALFSRYDRNGDGVIDYAEFQQGLFPLEGDQHNKNVHRHLVRSDLVDPVPGSARGPQATVFDGLVKQEASKAAQSRLKKGPLYYSAVPSRKQMRQAHHGVNHHPPEFRTVPLLKAGQEEHYFSGVNETSKVYNPYFPPSTATKAKPPWAHAEVNVPGGRSQSMMSHRGSSTRRGPKSDWRSASSNGGMSRRSGKGSLLNYPGATGDVFAGATL